MSEANVETVEPVSSLPSGEPVDSSFDPSTDPSPAAPDSSATSSTTSKPAGATGNPSTPAAKPVTSALSTVPPSPSSIDAILAHIHRCAEPRAGADVILFFLAYASRFGAAALDSMSRLVLKRSARQLVAAAYKLPPSTTVVLSSSSPTPPRVVALAMQLSGRLKALSGMLGEWRVLGRLWGLLGLYFAAKKLVLKSRSEQRDPEKSGKSTGDKFETAVAYAQIISLISFQATENAAFLSSKKVLGFSPVAQRKLARWSVRSWMLYVFMELGRLLVERSRKTDAEKRDAAWSEQWTKSFTHNLSWAPLTVHWSVDDGPLPELAISCLGLYPAISAIRDLWRSKA